MEFIQKKPKKISFMKLKYYLNLDILLIKHFAKIKNDVYHLEADNRQENLYAYIFKNGEDIYNYIFSIFDIIKSK